MPNTLKIILSLIVLSIFLPTVLIAQPGGPPATPIDGGLSLLLAVGGAYGLKKILRKSKEF